MASSVRRAKVALAADLSTRKSVTTSRTPKKPAAANVNHIGNAGRRQSWSSDVAQAQVMGDVP